MAETRIRGGRLTREERLTVRRLISDGRSFEEATGVHVYFCDPSSPWSCALEFSWTLDCERVLAGGVSR